MQDTMATTVHVVVKTLLGDTVHEFDVRGDALMRDLHKITEDWMTELGEASHAIDVSVNGTLVTLAGGVASEPVENFAVDGVIEALLTQLDLSRCVLNEREPQWCGKCLRCRPLFYCRLRSGLWLCNACRESEPSSEASE